MRMLTLVRDARGRNWVRILVTTNVLLFLVYAALYIDGPVYSALKTANLADAVASSVFLTLLISTVFAAILLLKRLFQMRNRSTEAGSRIAVLDIVLFLTWCISFGGLCLYAFILGTGG